ncbi:hypothetical protein HPB47_027182 [Ixodes persulcatus]|uniref:Uncharacterized protein n=1 Tax=Ixodes persulcatus TaxID=34615 RepID=A0AC60PX80_IXOPE|nr:hypothetical protein HPB47_027182 [Ixodes persulcatus]
MSFVSRSGVFSLVRRDTSTRGEGEEQEHDKIVEQTSSTMVVTYSRNARLVATVSARAKVATRDGDIDPREAQGHPGYTRIPRCGECRRYGHDASECVTTYADKLRQSRSLTVDVVQDHLMNISEVVDATGDIASSPLKTQKNETETSTQQPEELSPDSESSSSLPGLSTPADERRELIRSRPRDRVTTCLRHAINMATGCWRDELNEVELQMLEYSESLGLVPYAGTPDP